jgi:hypothetical protein
LDLPQNTQASRACERLIFRIDFDVNGGFWLNHTIRAARLRTIFGGLTFDPHRFALGVSRIDVLRLVAVRKVARLMQG